MIKANIPIGFLLKTSETSVLDNKILVIIRCVDTTNKPNEVITVSVGH